MYKLENVQVNIASEIKELIRYTSSRWENIPALEDVIRLAAQAGLHDARCWIDHYPVATSLRERKTTRSALLKSVMPKTGAHVDYYDQPCVWLDALESATSRLEEAAQVVDGAWDFTRKSDAVYASIRKQYPDLALARPLGWDALAKNYSDFDGMEEYCQKQQRADVDDFKGADSCSAGASGFPGRIALPYVMYDSECQGRPAPRVLVSSVYAHFLQIARHVNTQALIAALAQLQLRDTEPGPVWELTVTAEQPMLRALIALTAYNLAARKLEGVPPGQSPQETYAQDVKRNAEFDSKTDEEKAVLRKAHELDIAEFMAAMTSKHDSDKYDRECAAELKVAKALLKQNFPT